MRLVPDAARGSHENTGQTNHCPLGAPMQFTTERGAHLIGVLGGMGPAATADFYRKLINATPATRDQDHRRVVIWADPTVPDRSEALQGRGPDPTPWLVAGARRLSEAGATQIAIPCNTAHAFIDGIAEKVGVPIVHMIDAVAQRLSSSARPIGRVGLLATTGTVQGGFYQAWLAHHGIETVVTTAAAQESVMRAIRSIKGGQWTPEDLAGLHAAANALVQDGADAIIAGCTEIPLGLSPDDVAVPLIDPAQVLAETLVSLTAGPAHRA
ncbi:aspartate/glutamate racemase family protein [Prauserella cavernicola]|uniref:Amino acid racemase n=1 Tax=Prauserella cavernicola TaxID=2800127 RepID=A0A934V525_9PSEU|nr:amino acid racemase [Prauserella cavernicola]MBK1786012.1 amino acid racemase [Prauserella cavernicola]